MLLQALETNFKEYNQIRSELEEIMEEIKTLNDLSTTNEDALRILACSKTPQSGGLNPNAMTNLRASNMSHVGIKHRYSVKLLCSKYSTRFSIQSDGQHSTRRTEQNNGFGRIDQGSESNFQPRHTTPRKTTFIKLIQ